MDIYFAAQPLADVPPESAPLLKRCETLCLTWRALSSRNDAGVPAASWEAYSPKSEDKRLEEKTCAMARAWHWHAKNDFTRFHDISLAETYYWIFWTQSLFPAFKFLAACENAVDRHCPKTIYCDDTIPQLFRDVLSCASKSLSCDFKLILASRESENSLRHVIPAMTRNRWKQWALQCLNQLASWGRANDHRPGILLSYYPHMENLVNRLMAADSSFRLMMLDGVPKKDLKSLLRNGVLFWNTPRSEPSLGQDDLREMERIAGLWQQAKAGNDYGTLFFGRKLSLWPMIEPILDDFVAKQIPGLAWSCLQLEREWDRNPPALVLSPYDGPPLQQLTEQLARLRHTPSAILLHGLSSRQDMSFDNRSADQLLVWGPEQVKLYQHPGNGSSRKLIAAGNPKFDSYAGRHAPKNASNGPIKKVLLMSYPRDLCLTDIDSDRAALAVAQAVTTTTDWRVTLKLHPSESLTHYQDLLSHLSGKIQIVRDIPLGECLEDSDLVMGPFSTALMEAILLGIPLLCVNLSGDPISPPFNEDWGMPPITDPEDLAKRLKDCVSDPAGMRRTILSAYPKILKNFAGPTDGSATQAVLDALSRVIENQEKTPWH